MQYFLFDIFNFFLLNTPYTCNGNSVVFLASDQSLHITIYAGTKHYTSAKMSIIQTSTLTQQVVNLLKQRILDGELLSGQRVWAADLAQEFGVSLAPIKEALLILQGEGLIINVQNQQSLFNRCQADPD